MNPQEFERTIALGLGRAIIFLKNHDSHHLRDFILDACLHSKVADPQIDGIRSQYVLDLMRNSGDFEFFAEAVLSSLPLAANHHDLEQRFQVARLLAQNGHHAARQAMYSAAASQTNTLTQVALEFVELDQLKGLLFVVDLTGAQLSANPNLWENDELIQSSVEICGNDDIEGALKVAASTNSHIEAYLAAVEANRQLRTSHTRPDAKTITYAELRSRLGTNWAGSIIDPWRLTASEEDVEQAAQDMIRESDPKRLRMYLRIFMKRTFPLHIDSLLRLLKQPDGPIVNHTLRVLSTIMHDKVRALAFELVEKNPSRSGYSIDLLAKNFRDGDHSTIEAWCEAEGGPGARGYLTGRILDFYNENPNPESEARVLLKLYEKEPCAHCRHEVVERLLALEALPENLRLECEYDAYPATRKLVQT